MPAYASIDPKEHGDTLTHTEMNAILDNIEHIYDIVTDDVANTLHQGDAGFDYDYTIIHRQRWLHYNSTGEIIDPSGVGDTVTLSEPETDFGSYDLNAVNWLYDGMTYIVKGTDFAAEDPEP